MRLENFFDHHDRDGSSGLNEQMLVAGLQSLRKPIEEKRELVGECLKQLKQKKHNLENNKKEDISGFL